MLRILNLLRLNAGKTDPFAVTHGVLDVLERNAIERGETQSIHRIREARKTVTREALKPLPTSS